MTRTHKFAPEQRLEVQSDDMPPVVEVVVLLSDHCKEHEAPYYGCVHNNDHFRICEDILKELSPTNRKKLN